MTKAKNLIGNRYGKLVVIEKAYIKNRKQYWKLQCDCGNITYVSTGNLEKTHSCGCSHENSRLKNLNKARTVLKDTVLVNGTDLNKLSNKLIKSNKSGIKGVCWDKSRQKWLAQIEFQGKNHYLGRFDQKVDAIKARKDAEKKYFKPILEKYKDGYIKIKQGS